MSGATFFALISVFFIGLVLGLAANMERIGRVARWRASITSHQSPITESTTEGSMQAEQTAVAPATLSLITLTIPRIGAYWAEQGGDFLGIVAGDEGQPDYLLIGGQIAPEAMNHADALAWAQGLQQHGFNDWDIPNRRDGLVAEANNKGKIPADWYWLKDQSAHVDAYAWAQFFGDGLLDFSHKSVELEVVLVRRVSIR